MFVCFVFVFTARKSDSISQTLYVFCRCFVYAVLFLTLRGFYGGGGSHGCLLFLTVIFFYGVFVKDVFLQELQLLPVFNVTFPGVDDV